MSDRTEEEQVEALKSWFEENGTQLVVTIVVVLAVVFGYRSWEDSKQETSESASVLYEQLSQAVNVGPFGDISAEQKSTARFVAEQLKTEFPDSTYAGFAAMHLAKLAVEAEDLESAEAELSWAIKQNVDDNLNAILHARLARVKLAQKQFDAALAELKKVKPGAHKSTFDEIKGDVYIAMDKVDDARQAYQDALAAVANPDMKPLLKMKLQDIVAPAKAISADEPGAGDKTGESSEG